MATPALRRQVLEALQAAVGSEDVPGTAAKSLKIETRDWIVLDYVTAVHSRASEFLADPRQEWLDLGLPKFSHVHVSRGESLQDYRAETRKLALRIKSYKHKRRNVASLERDRLELSERALLEKSVAPFFSTDTTMTMDRAIEMLAKSTRPNGRRRPNNRKGERS